MINSRPYTTTTLERDATIVDDGEGSGLARGAGCMILLLNIDWDGGRSRNGIASDNQLHRLVLRFDPRNDDHRGAILRNDVHEADRHGLGLIQSPDSPSRTRPWEGQTLVDPAAR
jgi:hypothetical protein